MGHKLTVYALSFKHSLPEDGIVIDVTSRSKTWSKYLSPFNLGPIDLYDGYFSFNLENAFQFSKVYPEHVDIEGLPSSKYWEWAKKGWKNTIPIKYPMGAWNKHLFHWWKGEKLSNLEAQNNIFVELYKKAVIKTTAFSRLKDLYETSKTNIYLIDFEGYDHRYLGLSWNQVLQDANRPVGQAFVLAMMLEGFLK